VHPGPRHSHYALASCLSIASKAPESSLSKASAAGGETPELIFRRATGLLARLGGIPGVQLGSQEMQAVVVLIELNS
jgi:hypothetical protein